MNNTQDNNLDNAFIKATVLSVPEVAEKLHLTKQRIYALIKAGKLKPAKAGTLTLFTSAEIDRFINGRIQKAQPKNSNPCYPVYYDRAAGRGTINSETFWSKYKEKIDCIEEIRIYGDTHDAAIDGYFQMGQPSMGPLHYFDAPSMIIKAKNDVQLWLQNCNCGYDGTGSKETVRILIDAQISGLLKSDYTKEDWEKFIFNEEKCIIQHIINEEEDTITCYAETESILGRDHKITDWHQLFTSTAQFFARESGLVLVQSENPTMTDEIEKAFNLQLHMDFLPNPVSYKYFQNKETAMEGGYYCLSHAGKITGYQLILFDEKGREIWIETIEEPTRKFTRSETISDLLQEIGYELPFDISSLPEKDIRWFNKQVERTNPDKGKALFVRHDA